MIKKIIEIGVILWCLALPFGCTAARFSARERSNYAANFHERIGPRSYRLPNDTKPETYNISLRTGISEGQFDFDGSIAINILILNATREVTIHSQKLNIQSIRLSNATDMIDLLPWRANTETDFLIIPTKSVELLPSSRYQLSLKFSGHLQERSRGFFRKPSDKRLTNKRWIAMTHFQPLEARSAFPCYDEPALKAKVTIQITHGANYSAISNMHETRSVNSDGSVTTRFATSPLMSTYLIAFAVTDFRFRASSATNTIPMRVFAAPIKYEKTRFALVAGEKVLKTLESYLQVPYVLPKMDQIFLLRFGKAMENWGLITYGQDLLINERTSSLEKKLSSFSLIAHEFCHQWFGNIVSPKWWSYTWLNEGFATFFENIVIDLIHPEYKISDRFLAYTAVSFQLDVRDVVQPMVQYVEEPDSVADMFNFVSYLKSTCVIRMFWNALTEATFKKGLKIYLTINAYTAVDEDDLFRELDRAAKEDGTLDSSLNMQEIFSSWTRQAGFPVLIVRRNYENGSITISQERYTTDRFNDLVNASAWWIPYNIVTSKSPSFNVTRTDDWLLRHQRTKLIEPRGDNVWAPTDWVLFNKQVTGYYRVMYDTTNWKLLTAELNSGPNNKIHPYSRAQLLDDMESFVKTDRLPKEALIEMVKYLKYETEYAPWLAGSKALLYLNKTLASTDGYETFRHMTVSIIESFERRPVVKIAYNDSFSLVRTRQVVYELSCRLGFTDCPDITEDEIEN